MAESIESELKEIHKTLVDVRAILILTNQDKLDETKRRLLPPGSMKAKIYDLCDGTKTTKAIADAIGKDEGYVRANLSTLRRDGLVRTAEKEGTQVHEQIF